MAGAAGAQRKATPPTAATIMPAVKPRKSIVMVRRRATSTLARGLGFFAFPAFARPPCFAGFPAFPFCRAFGFTSVAGTARARTSTAGSASASDSGSGSAVAAYLRSRAARPDNSRMAVLKRSVGRASLSSSCLRSHIGTK